MSLVLVALHYGQEVAQVAMIMMIVVVDQVSTDDGNDIIIN